MKWSIPERIIAKGRTYLADGRVLSVTPDPAQQVWHAEVLGSELYQIELDATAKEEDFCQCPYWEEHHYCKHTVAVELYLRQAGKSRQLPKTQVAQPTSISTADVFTSGLKRLIDEEGIMTSLPSLVIEADIDSLVTNPYHPEMDVLGISLKIGEVNGRKYVIKNIYKFLQVFMEQKQYTVNKKYTFHLGKHVFDQDTKAVLLSLHGLAQTHQLLGQTGIQIKGKLDKKYLLLPVESAQVFVQRLQKVAFQWLSGTASFAQVTFVTSETPLQFAVQSVADQADLLIDDSFDQVWRHYNWALKGQTIYCLSEKQVTTYLTLEQLRKRLPTTTVTYPKAELSVLFSHVLPVLETIGQVAVQPEVVAMITEEPLQASYILRKKKGMIDATVHFHYGECVFSSNADETTIVEQQQEILRDMKQEKRVTDLLATLGFRKTATGWERALPTGSALFQFFTVDIPLMRQLGTVKMGKKLRELYLDDQLVEPKVSVGQESSWLSVKFDISGIAENEIDAMLRSLMQQDRFYALENGQIISFETEAFQETAQVLQHLREGFQLTNGQVLVPKNQGIALQQSLGNTVAYSDSFQQMTQDLIHPEQFVRPLPERLQALLRDYQITGYRWLKMLSYYQFGGILADEMGLGKTLQTITYLLSEKQEQGKLGALIVAPASLTYNWSQEIKRFSPELVTVVVSGSKEEREQLIDSPADVWITSYASLRQDIERYQELAVDYLILDEAQMVKNSGTKTAQALRSLSVRHRFALSGTPIENNLDELWSLFQLIMPGFFPSRANYRQMAPETVAQMIQPFILRRDKRTVLKDLPEKIETNYYSGLTTEQKTIYLAYLRQMQEEISRMDSATFKKNRISILAGLTRLRQICCDPRLFIEDYTGGAGKLEQVKDLLVAAKENNRRVLLFSQFTSMLSLIEGELDTLGLTHFYLRGSTPPKERIQMVDEFNEGARDVFLISLKAGGTGLNLTGADTVILYDLWWNPAVEEQAAGRAHRMGQKNVVEVWRMISEGTIEERMDTLQNEKRELFQKVIQGNEVQLQQMTEEDIRLILSMGEEESPI